MEFDRNPTLDALCARKSVRVFTEEPVPQAVKKRAVPGGHAGPPRLATRCCTPSSTSPTPR